MNILNDDSILNRAFGFFLRLVSKVFFGTWIRFKLWRFFRLFSPGRQPKSWVFMGGCYNSGTTILREIIGAHPEISSLPREGVVLTDAFPDLEQNGWTRMWHRNAELADLHDKSPEGIAKVAKSDWSLWWRRGAGVFLEKSIVHCAWMPFLQQSFDNPRFISVVRNGYCVCEGIRRRARPTGLARQTVQSDVYPIDMVGQQWVHANEIIQKDKAGIENYLEIRYENLVDEPLRTLREIFRFIGVDSEVVTETDTGQICIGGHSFDISNQNVASLGRLSESDRAELQNIIGPMMKRLGYDPSGFDE